MNSKISNLETFLTTKNWIEHEILILYGSQTGTAKLISEEIFRELNKRKFNTQLYAFDNYDITNLPFEKYVIFIVSTAGQGDPPDNMKNSWKFLLLKDLPNDVLGNVKFTVFGLGDSAYAKFNAMARKLYQRLLQLGAKTFHERGLGDDQHEFGYESEFIPWLDGLWRSLKANFPDKNYDIKDDVLPDPIYLIDVVLYKQQLNDTGDTDANAGAGGSDGVMKMELEDGKPQESKQKEFGSMTTPSQDPDNMSMKGSGISGQGGKAEHNGGKVEHNGGKAEHNGGKAEQHGGKAEYQGQDQGQSQDQSQGKGIKNGYLGGKGFHNNGVHASVASGLKQGEISKEEYMNLNRLHQGLMRNKEIYLAKIAKNVVLTAADNEKAVHYLELKEVNNKGFKYYPGDISVIQPRNDIKTCELLIELLGLEKVDKVRIRLNSQYLSQSNPFPPGEISLRFLFEFWLNVMSPPTKYFFQMASYFTNDELHKEKLRILGSRSNEGKIEYQNYCIKERRNVYEILYDFNTVKMPLNYLIEAIGVQKPREFSICTSNLLIKNKLGITITVIKYQTPFKRTITGICTGWLSKASSEEIIPLWIKKGVLNFPSDINTPIILISPGTGLAPMLSFLEERVILMEMSQEKIEQERTIIFFGNRYKEKDFLHKDLLLLWEKEKKYLNLAFFFPCVLGTCRVNFNKCHRR